MEDIPIDMTDLRNYEKEIHAAYEELQRSFDRFVQRMNWAFDDAARAEGEGHMDRALAMQFSAIKGSITATSDFQEAMMPSLTPLAMQMALDFADKGVLELPDSARGAIEKYLAKQKSHTIEGIGSFEDIMKGAKEPQRPNEIKKEEEQKPKQGIRDFDGNIE